MSGKKTLGKISQSFPGEIAAFGRGIRFDECSGPVFINGADRCKIAKKDAWERVLYCRGKEGVIVSFSAGKQRRINLLHRRIKGALEAVAGVPISPAYRK